MKLKLIIESGPSIKKLKENRRTLSDDEWEEVQDAKATWSDGKSAVWKSEINGKTYYVSNTHRTYSANTSLKKTIKDFHDYVEESS